MTAERRSRPRREAPELGAMMRRMLRALVRRASEGDLFALEQLGLLRGQVEASLAAAARGAHDMDGGYSWTEIGRELGITRQAARQLYGDQGGRNGD